ncbi:enoyl-CoA hydratase/isomerase family protein [Actinoallomurus sp. CA-142502]|uniref:enoyl-CoA hydratase/isomerase family protein n=1 Tax=Actinoallomurus sp. CA-142502 TaxID=3239885 RepID=UPI003D8C4E62
MIDLRREGDVHVLRFDDGENRFSPDFLDALSAALDELTAAPAPKALVTTGTGKFYSNGLDLDWLSADADRWGPYLERVHGLFARMLTLPMPTVAAVNGHAFAAGAMLSLAHDYRVMRADRGWFCLPEVDLGLPFTPGMSALIQARLPKLTAHEAMVTGRRYAGKDAVAAGIAHRAVAEAEVAATALALAAPLAAKDGATVARIRTDLYRPVLDVLT